MLQIILLLTILNFSISQGNYGVYKNLNFELINK